MANLSNFAQVIYLERFPKLDTATHAAPTNFYACLCSSLPTVSQTGATMPEVGNVGGYARTVIAFANAFTEATRIPPEQPKILAKFKGLLRRSR